MTSVKHGKQTAMDCLTFRLPNSLFWLFLEGAKCCKHGSLTVCTLDPDLLFEYGPSFVFAKKYDCFAV